MGLGICQSRVYSRYPVVFDCRHKAILESLAVGKLEVWL